jgi:hypothetical protein
MKNILLVTGLMLALGICVELTGIRSSIASEVSIGSQSAARGEPIVGLDPGADGPQDRDSASSPVESQPVSPAELPLLLEQASTFERAIIGDGVVTREELLAAFGELNACVENAAAAVGGVTVLPADFSGDIPRLGGAQSADKSALDAVGEAALACDDEYFDHVYAAWGSTTAREQKQPLWDEVAACLRGKGYDTPSGLSRTEIALTVGKPGEPIPDFYACEESISR